MSWDWEQARSIHVLTRQCGGERLANMKRKGTSIFTVLRIAIAAACVILFILQSYQEVDKFFKGMTSVAVRTEVQNDIPHPSIVVCPKEPYKEGVFPLTMDKYLNITFSFIESSHFFYFHSKYLN